MTEVLTIRTDFNTSKAYKLLKLAAYHANVHSTAYDFNIDVDINAGKQIILKISTWKNQIDKSNVIHIINCMRTAGAAIDAGTTLGLKLLQYILGDRQCQFENGFLESLHNTIDPIAVNAVSSYVSQIKSQYDDLNDSIQHLQQRYSDELNAMVLEIRTRCQAELDSMYSAYEEKIHSFKNNVFSIDNEFASFYKISPNSVGLCTSLHLDSIGATNDLNALAKIKLPWLEMKC